MIEEIRKQYREVRKNVYNESTRPNAANNDMSADSLHLANKNQFRKKVESICQLADLNNYRSNTPEAKISLWHHLWTKNRYAGIRSELATNEIKDITPLFDKYDLFAEPGWNIDANGHNLERERTGEIALSFVDRTGVFFGLRTVRNRLYAVLCGT